VDEVRKYGGVPESPDGTGGADGFAPPNKLFNTCAISAEERDAQCQLAMACVKSWNVYSSKNDR
jgi:hypothetical protein